MIFDFQLHCSCQILLGPTNNLRHFRSLDDLPINQISAVKTLVSRSQVNMKLWYVL